MSIPYDPTDADPLQEYEKKPRAAPVWRGFRRIPVIVLTVFAVSGQATANPELDRAFERDTIVIEAGTCYRFDVWLALTPEQHRRGLMHVRNLPQLAGMLFVYPDSAMRSMWMKNTYIPLDILFILEDGTISSIATDTEPLSLTSIPSTEPIQYVLELNAGVTESLGIEAGSRILIPRSVR